MSQVVEGTEDNLTITRRALTAGNTNATMQPMDVAEAAYYKQHPEEAPGYEPAAPPAGETPAPTSAPADAATPIVAPEDTIVVFTDFEITPENAETVRNFVTRGEFNRFVDATNEAFQILEDRIAKYNKGASHKF
jgi:hypothetical protein